MVIIMQDWLGFMIKDHHGVAVFDFLTLSGCDHAAVCWPHPYARGGTLDILMTDVPDLVYDWVLW